MFNDLTKGISSLNEAELEEISLKETLSLEEAICDTIFPDSLKENAQIAGLTKAGTPIDAQMNDIVSGLQFHNQDYLGIPEDDAHNFDPDNNLDSHSRGTENKLVEQLLGIKESYTDVNVEEDENLDADEDDEFADEDASEVDEGEYSEESMEEQTSLVDSLLK